MQLRQVHLIKAKQIPAAVLILDKQTVPESWWKVLRLSCTQISWRRDFERALNDEHSVPLITRTREVPVPFDLLTSLFTNRPPQERNKGGCCRVS